LGAVREQALNIPTKINKGTVEIVSDVALIKTGDKVGGSEATLLAKLGIRPFSYGLIILQVRPRVQTSALVLYFSLVILLCFPVGLH
jgi:ribosomal protein L10